MVLQKSKNLFASSKKNHYGIGLSNIKDIVEKYNGLVDIDTANNIFTVKITLPLP